MIDRLRLAHAVLLLPQVEAPPLKIDPLLLGQVIEVFDVIAADEPRGWTNPVWPGWNARDTPILLYLPEEQDALLNHPDPPEGFQSAPCGLLPEGWTLHLRNETTVFDQDGQNTSTDVGGVETLVVADSISNLRPNLVQLLRDEGDVYEKEERLTASLLSTDPYTQLSFVVHEAFHVHQFSSASGKAKAAIESWLLEYPWLAADNLAGFALEGRLLERVLRASDATQARRAALEFLAVRLDRRRSLSEKAVAYEDGTEFSEGLAKYTEWALSLALEGREPGEPMRWSRGFRGYGDLGFWREELLDQLRVTMDGSIAVNGDPYGAGGLRFRLYSSGMAIGVLLDRLEVPGWHERILEPGTTLTSLAQEALSPSDAELGEALVVARANGGYSDLLEEKRAFESAGWADADQRAQAVLASETSFVLDYGALEDIEVQWSFTPFGVTRLADGRTIYGVVPLSAELGTRARFQQEVALAALHDVEGKTIRFGLKSSVDALELPSGEIDESTLALPGVSVSFTRGEVSVLEGRVHLRLLE